MVDKYTQIHVLRVIKQSAVNKTTKRIYLGGKLMEVQQTGKAEVRREGEEEKDEKNEVKLEKRLCRCSRIVYVSAESVSPDVICISLPIS
ncbi:hypothetical protein POVWA1_053770 [Plasmodium ovale wallikeri]|uniref:Uncharacterized protein n=1 Tax=Plasmodium ovale wallikeri TaxID=864142 RepID=A0A1A8ZR97_PLAOA|nr:hypothetical protein POVWA1_053770 [Plasmodium ovale wallikeri]